MAWSSDPQFRVTHHAGVPLVISCNSDGVDQIVVPKSGKLCEILIEELYMTPLDSHLAILKLTHTLFQRTFRPKLPETVTSFVWLYTTCAQTKKRTAVPFGLLQPLLVPESGFYS